MTAERRAQLVGVARDLMMVAGAGLVSVGSGMVYFPAGFIVGGVLLLAGAIRSAR